MPLFWFGNILQHAWMTIQAVWQQRVGHLIAGSDEMGWLSVVTYLKDMKNNFRFVHEILTNSASYAEKLCKILNSHRISDIQITCHVPFFRKVILMSEKVNDFFACILCIFMVYHIYHLWLCGEPPIVLSEAVVDESQVLGKSSFSFTQAGSTPGGRPRVWLISHSP